MERGKNTSRNWQKKWANLRKGSRWLNEDGHKGAAQCRQPGISEVIWRDQAMEEAGWSGVWGWVWARQWVLFSAWVSEAAVWLTGRGWPAWLDAFQRRWGENENSPSLGYWQPPAVFYTCSLSFLHTVFPALPFSHTPQPSTLFIWGLLFLITSARPPLTRLLSYSRPDYLYTRLHSSLFSLRSQLSSLSSSIAASSYFSSFVFHLLVIISVIQLSFILSR